MNNNPENRQRIFTKIKDINTSINTMVDCVKNLEKMRSQSYLSTLSDEDLQEVLKSMQQLEQSIEKLSTPPKENKPQHTFLKAVGKNRKLLVTKPDNNSNNSSKDRQNVTLPNPKIIPKAAFSKQNSSMDPVLKSPERPENLNHRSRRISFKQNI